MNSPPPSPSDIELSTYALVLLISFWGGLVNFLHRLKKFKNLSLNNRKLAIDLAIDLIISGFSGLLVFWLCTWKGLDPLISSVITGVSGHLGTRTIFLLEKVFEAQAKKMLSMDIEKDLD